RGRTLTERGRKEAGLIGAYMASHALIPDRVLVSTATRCQQTWQHAAEAFKAAPAATSIEQLYNATQEAVLAVVKDTPAAAHTLLVIGHNPGLHDLALTL